MKKKRSRGAARKRPSGAAKRAKRNLQALVAMPGVNLAQLYNGVVMESRNIGDAPHVPAYPSLTQILDRVAADAVMKVQAEGDAIKTAKVVLQFMRATNSAEHSRVNRYMAETALGAAAMQVDGVNQVNKIKQELRAERKTRRTIETFTEELSVSGSVT